MGTAANDQRGGCATGAGDERRLTVRAYHHWTGLLAGRPCPETRDCDLLALPQFAPHAILLERGGAWLVRFIGGRLAEAPESWPARIAGACAQVLERRAPAELDSDVAGAEPPPILYRGILLPFAAAGGAIERVVGVISWKERLGRSVGASALPPAGPVPVARLPALAGPLVTWADGPLGEAAEDRRLLPPSTALPPA